MRAFENNSLLRGKVLQIRSQRKKNKVRCTPIGGRGNGTDNTALMKEVLNIWEDLQLELLKEDQDLQEEIRETFNTIDEEN